MSVSSALIGTLYIPNYHGIAWTQPGGPGTTVYPTQGDGPWLQYPVSGQFLAPSSEALWHPGCGHGIDFFTVLRDFDLINDMSAAVIICGICSYLIQLIEPYENATTSIDSWTQYPILVG